MNNDQNGPREESEKKLFGWFTLDYPHHHLQVCEDVQTKACNTVNEQVCETVYEDVCQVNSYLNGYGRHHPHQRCHDNDHNYVSILIIIVISRLRDLPMADQAMGPQHLLAKGFQSRNVAMCLGKSATMSRKK